MEIGPDPKLAAYLALARQFVESCMQRLDITYGDQNTQSLIETLLQKTSASNKEDRALIRNLKALKALIEQCNEPLPKDQSNLQERFRDVLLKCGFDASSLDNVAVGPKIPQEQNIEHSGESALDAEALKEAGNKYFNAGDYQKALLYYDKLFSMPNIPSDLFVKVAGNKLLTLLRWKGTTAEHMQGAMKTLAKALQLEPKNAKLLYRISQGAEWLGPSQLNYALFCATRAQDINPDDDIVNKHVANLRQKVAYKNTAEHLDDRYRSKSENETKEKINLQFPGLDMNKFLNMAKDFEGAYAMQGHRERDINKDYVAAAEYYQKAADAGYPEGLLNLAALYTQGLGVGLDLHKAVKLLQQAVRFDPSKTGVVESYVALGLKYFRGIAVEQNLETAKYWFQKAADQGFSEGELNLGIIYEFEYTYNTALDLFESAALKGCARAYAALGDIYKYGKGFKIDLKKARKMYEKALRYGLTIDVEEELEISDNPFIKKQMIKWKMLRLAASDSNIVYVTDEDVDYLRKQQHSSPVARSILLGWESFEKATKLVDKESADTQQILKLFSDAIQRCSSFIAFMPKYAQYLTRTIEFELVMAEGTIHHDLVVCGSYFAFPLSSLVDAGLRKCAFGLAKLAVFRSDELEDKAECLEMVNHAIWLEPQNVDLLFYKARITEAVEDFLQFVEIAPFDHYWRPRAFYCIAEQLMKKNATAEEVFKFYQLGLEAEKHQLFIFLYVEFNEKNIVAGYLVSAQKLNRHPSVFMRFNQHRRKELLAHQHNAMKDQFGMMVSDKQGKHTFYTTQSNHRPQPNPTALSYQRECFFEDLDLTKEHIFKDCFIECLILAPPIKKFGIVTVVEDKKGITCRVLLYDDISLVHIEVGQWIRLYNPYVRIAQDNRSALKVTNKKCFEVLQFEKICHCCTRLEGREPNPGFIACPGCQSAHYCSPDCFEQHQNEFKHKIVCRYLNFDKKKKHKK